MLKQGNFMKKLAAVYALLSAGFIQGQLCMRREIPVPDQQVRKYSVRLKNSDTTLRIITNGQNLSVGQIMSVVANFSGCISSVFIQTDETTYQMPWEVLKKLKQQFENLSMHERLKKVEEYCDTQHKLLCMWLSAIFRGPVIVDSSDWNID